MTATHDIPHAHVLIFNDPNNGFWVSYLQVVLESAGLKGLVESAGLQALVEGASASTNYFVTRAQHTDITPPPRQSAKYTKSTSPPTDSHFHFTIPLTDWLYLLLGRTHHLAAVTTHLSFRTTRKGQKSPSQCRQDEPRHCQIDQARSGQVRSGQRVNLDQVKGRTRIKSQKELISGHRRKSDKVKEESRTRSKKQPRSTK